ncbi:MAG: GNAT family N-acetyltransferase [Kiritimatiellia bacterium]|jgi:ribosomal protein S18 acetylase RimI-like enzyme
MSTTLEKVTTPSQIAAVAELAREIWEAHYTPLIGTAQVAYMLARFQSEAAIAQQITMSGFEYYLAPEAGYLALVPDSGERRMLLSKIYVKESQRRTGLGRQMVDLAEQRCRETGCTTLWLTVNRHNSIALAFYERVGFVKARKLVTDIGGGFVMDDWQLEKEIPVTPPQP